MIPRKACTLIDDSKVGALLVMIPRRHALLLMIPLSDDSKDWVIIPMYACKTRLHLV
jgi:hypothetical protein